MILTAIKFTVTKFELNNLDILFQMLIPQRFNDLMIIIKI